MKALILLCLMAGPLAAQSADGQRYPVFGGPVVHTLTKSAASFAVYELAKPVIRSPVVRGAIAWVGVFAVSKAIELQKGHTLGPWDTVHDFAAHGLLVLPLVTKKPWLGSLNVGVMVSLCAKASPREC